MQEKKEVREMPTVRTSKQWEELVPKKYKLVIMDPDGWDRKNFDWSFNQELITKDEFMNRIARSTIRCGMGMFADKW